MSQVKEQTTQGSWISRHWKKTTAFAALLVAFLGGYNTIRGQLPLAICDAAGLIGQQDSLSLCQRLDQPTDSDLLSKLEFLKGREDKLSPAQREQLQRLEAAFEKRAFAVLSQAMMQSEIPVDALASNAAREAVKETVEKGSTDERQALAKISQGDLTGGLRQLESLATAQAEKSLELWRRIGRLAYGVDTQRALNAYQKIIALDTSDPWDAIYLGRLYARAGNLAEARRTFEDALARLPKAAERDRSALLNEIGDVLTAQGDLPGAQQSYRDAMAIREHLAAADPENAQWQRDLAVSQWKLAGYADSGVTWTDVITTFDAMAARGILLPGDQQFAEEARRLAASE